MVNIIKKNFRLSLLIIGSICFVASVFLFKLVQYNHGISYGNDDNVVSSKLTVRRNKYKFTPITTIPLPSTYRRRPPAHTYLSQYKLHVCKIPKSAATVMREILCYITDPLKFGNHFVSTSQDWNPTLKSDVNKLCVKAYNEQEVSNVDVCKKTNVNHFAIIRDPVERFVSGWLDKCDSRKMWCFNCDDNINCFIEENYENIRQISKDSYQLSNWGPYRHFYPQTWICNFDQHLNQYNFLVHSKSHNEFAIQLDQFLESIGVTETVRETVKFAVTNKTTMHASSQKKSEDVLNKIYGNKTLRDILYKTYYIDYVTLGEKLNLNHDILDEM